MGLAYIIDLEGGGLKPSHPIAGVGPGPSHPIIIPGVPDPLPGSPSHPIYITGDPSHPIAISPPGIWGGPPLYPDQGLPPGSPGVPTHPIDLPEPLPPPPPEIAHNVVVAVWNPTSETWAVRVGEVKPAPHA
jgi:hypothetical protein